MKTFPFIKIEAKKYPTVIMGEDNFSGWFSKGKFRSEKERAKRYKETIETAYSLGVRGFSISPQKTLIKVLSKFKRKHKDIVCIANHHWQSNYYIGKESLWTKNNLERLGATEDKKIRVKKDKVWLNKTKAKPFSEEEIKNINLNENEYKKQLKKFKKFCDFCLVGNIGRSALLTLGREDIIKREIELARAYNFVPIGMCEGGGLAIEKMKKLNVSSYWVWINYKNAFPNLNYTLNKIKKSKKPITAYKIFEGGKSFNLKKSISFLKKIKQIKSIIVGVENKKQAQETFKNLLLTFA